ncbi:hypothetical protein AWR36_003975 [Microbulbifer flavimaris]|uniref:Type II secretion system protein L n=1 Tax=Microbulbifer flavimaris TaxID=1781068 RepID=A0ABX4I466_9GAMM|nr:MULTISPECIES: type II secretion system protein GspL [Microbulbifer]KUJ84809.1 hypothetical protein AVO43_03975 [Microbulbifer sp. ZGT114]PCO06906.1 hypothetical protein AWR36_003975 [Microbulbifer flavimaris]
MSNNSSTVKARSNTGAQTCLLRLVDAAADSGLRLQQWLDGQWQECAVPEAMAVALSGAGFAAGGADSEPPAEPVVSESDKVVLLLPGHWVWSGTEDIPKAARRQSRAVGYMVEERLAGDVENLHFVCQHRSGERCTVYAVDRERMSALRQAFNATGWSPLAVIPEYQLLDRGDDIDRLWLDGERAHLWQGRGLGLSVRRQYLRPLLDSLSGNASGDSAAADDEHPRHRLEALGVRDGMLEAELETLFGDRLELGDGQPEAELLARLKPAQLANLLTGEFKPDEPVGEQHWWRMPAKVAVACFVLQLAFFIAAGSYYHWRAASVEAEAQAMFTQLFPNDTPRADIRRQVEGYLRQSSGSAGGFASKMQELSRVWLQARGEGLRLQSVRFDGNRGDMVLQLQAENLTDLDNIVSQLSAGQVRAELLAANELEEGVSGRIRLR